MGGLLLTVVLPGMDVCLALFQMHTTARPMMFSQHVSLLHSCYRHMIMCYR